MSFRTAYGNIESEDGWRMCNADECDGEMIPGTAVAVPIRSGVPNTILKAFAARFAQLVEPLDQTQCGGWTLTNDVATSNHLAGTAMDLNWRRHPFHVRGTYGDRLPILRGVLNEFRGCVWWGGDWQDPIDEMHFQLNYAEGQLGAGGFTVNVDQRLADLAADLENGYLGIWKPADPNAFPLPHGYFYGPFDGPDQCISGEYPGEPQAWRDGLGDWQNKLGLPATKKWDDGKTPQAATTLQLAKKWPPTPSIGYGCIGKPEWDAVFTDGWRLPAGWDPTTVQIGSGTSQPEEFPLPQGYFWGPLDGPDESISGEYPSEPQAWRDGLGDWQNKLGLPATKKWDDGKTPQAATTLQLAKHWPATPGVGFGCVGKSEWDAVFTDGWRLPAGWDAVAVQMSGPSSSAAAIPVSAVGYVRGQFQQGQQAYQRYLGQTLDLMGITDAVARDNWTRGVLVAALRESSYDPDAVNDNDVNATGPRISDGFRANCSRGVLQTIPATFAAFHQPGTGTNIYDPVANTAAAMNYVMKRYGVQRDGSNLAAAVCQFNPHCGPRGY